ncbi:MAG: SLC13 family permease [Desulfovibrio sp.]|nr:SLC13 family permease [Desulfovibrio sp.]MCA1985453.1 SLC13 family permease [Desulfovibrio sp.]
MTAPAFSTDMALVFCVTGATIFLFITQWVRVDVTAILTMLALALLGLVEPRQTFQGLSSTAVVSIIAVVIMGRGLDHTGVITNAVRPLMRLAKGSRSRMLALLCAAIAVLSSFMQNIGAAALFLPAIKRLSTQTGIPLSRLLMPVGFCAILGGTVTLVGSSPLIMLNDLMRPFGLKPFSLFSVTPMGLTLVGLGIVYFLLLGSATLPKARAGQQAPPAPEPLEHYPGLGRLFEVVVPPVSPFSRSTEVMIMDLCDCHNIHTVALSPQGGKDLLIPPDREMFIRPGAIFAAYGPEEGIREAAASFGWEVRDQLTHFAGSLSPDMAGVVEAVVPPNSAFLGKTISTIHFRHTHHLAPLALSRKGEKLYQQLGEQPLNPGDTILMFGTWEAFHAMRPARDLLFVQPLDHEILHPRKAGLAVGWFMAATLLAIFSGLPLSVCLMSGAMGMVVTKVLSIDEAYRGVDWRTVFLLAGLIPLGTAMEKSQAAAWLAHQVLAVAGGALATPFVFYMIIAALSTGITLVVSNVGAMVLLTPLVIDIAGGVGADPRMAALVAAMAASNSFLLPTHQVNALYMGAGGYSAGDFLRAGGPLSLLFIIALAAMASLY